MKKLVVNFWQDVKNFILLFSGFGLVFLVIGLAFLADAGSRETSKTLIGLGMVFQIPALIFCPKRYFRAIKYFLSPPEKEGEEKRNKEA